MRGQRPLDNYYTAEVYIFERKCGIDTNHQCCKMKKNMCVAREAKEAAKLVLFATGWKSAPRDEPEKLALSSSPAVPILPLRGIFQFNRINACKNVTAARPMDGGTSPQKRERRGTRCECYCLLSCHYNAPRGHSFVILRQLTCSFLLPLDHHESQAFVCLSVLSPDHRKQHVGAPLPAWVLLSSGSGSGP